MNRSVWFARGILVCLSLAVYPAAAQMGSGGKGGPPGMMGSGGMGGPGMMGSGGMMGGGMGGGQTYDLPKAKRLMSEAKDRINQGKTQFAAGNFDEARRLFKEAKEKLDEVRGTDQQQGGMAGPGGASAMGPGGSAGPAMMGGSGGPAMMGGSGGPAMMGGSGGGMGMMGGSGGGMGGGTSTGIIPPDKVELVIEARVLWITAVMWWGKSWAGIAESEVLPQRVLLGSWSSAGATQQQGGMGGSGGSGGMMGPMGGGSGGPRRGAGMGAAN
jgi:hypothetical protein